MAVITGLVVRPLERPEVSDFDSELHSLQEKVGGYIEELCPFDDNVAIICNEEGKLNGLPFNRAVFDEDGRIIDVIVGNFLIVGTDDESGEYISLTEDQIERYQTVYYDRQMLIRENGQLSVLAG